MLNRLQLSVEHSEWLEASRGISPEVAPEFGVVSRGSDLGFEYRQNGVPCFVKFRRQTRVDGQPAKNFWIEPTGVALCLWNEDCLQTVLSDTLIITEGEMDALSFLTLGEPHVVFRTQWRAGQTRSGRYRRRQRTQPDAANAGS
jgi:hypothetical protein